MSQSMRPPTKIWNRCRKLALEFWGGEEILLLPPPLCLADGSIAHDKAIEVISALTNEVVGKERWQSAKQNKLSGASNSRHEHGTTNNQRQRARHNKA